MREGCGMEQKPRALVLAADATVDGGSDAARGWRKRADGTWFP